MDLPTPDTPSHDTPTEKLVSEESIVQQFLAPLAAGFPGAFGLKDDCAVAAPAKGHEFVFKTDAIAEGVHFRAEDRPDDIGWKALAVNVSDLAAKGARPVGYLLSLAFPQAPTREWMSGFARGLREAQSAFGIALIGGDTDRRPGPLSITPMVFGEVPTGRMVRRGSAVAGDIVFVSGTLGCSALGLRVLTEPGLVERWRLSLEQRAALETKYLRPAPRLALVEPLRQWAAASMDISDGLVKDLGRMCRASGVGAKVLADSLPVSDGFKTIRAGDPEAAAKALFAGDDYEILAAVPQQHAASFRAAASEAGVPVAAVGAFHTGAGVAVIGVDGLALDVGATGWDHF